MSQEAPGADLSRLLHSIAARKQQLDRLRPLPARAIARLEHYYNVELTYASNAIEGNTLGPVETTLVIEKGITIGGKPLKDHLEALDHFEAMRYIRELGRQSEPVTEAGIRNLHFLVVQRSQPEIAGRYADLPRFVRTETGRHVFPTPAEVPARMGDLAEWLRQAPVNPGSAFEAHRRLVDIHPFNDGNGRTARLLMNLILIRGGYPPIAVRPEDRLAYTRALERSQAGQGTEDFERLLCERLDATLAEYLRALEEASPPGAGVDHPPE
jgi:Fic family protein